MILKWKGLVGILGGQVVGNIPQVTQTLKRYVFMKYKYSLHDAKANTYLKNMVPISCAFIRKKHINIWNTNPQYWKIKHLINK